MSSTWSSGHAGGAALPGPGPVRVRSRGFHPRLSSSFTFSERPGACQVRIAALDVRSSSAERRDVNKPGPGPVRVRSRGFHPWLSSLFTFSEWPSACQVWIAASDPRSSSAERMDVNSRGWQPTEGRSPSRSTLKGSNNAFPGPNGPALPGPGPVRVRSRGCQPTEPRPKIRPTLEGSNHEHPANTGCITPFVRPFQGRTPIAGRSVGFTHGYSHGSPPVNRGLRQFQNADSLLVNGSHRLVIWPSRLCVFARAPHA
jgi:hypothetical protein